LKIGANDRRDLPSEATARARRARRPKSNGLNSWPTLSEVVRGCPTLPDVTRRLHISISRGRLTMRLRLKRRRPIAVSHRWLSVSPGRRGRERDTALLVNQAASGAKARSCRCVCFLSTRASAKRAHSSWRRVAFHRRNATTSLLVSWRGEEKRKENGTSSTIKSRPRTALRHAHAAQANTSPPINSSSRRGDR
jgi:hypothetical protein